MGEVRCETHFKAVTGLFCPVCLLTERDELLDALDALYREVEVNEILGDPLANRDSFLRAGSILVQRGRLG